MTNRLRALPVVALLLAAADTVLVRARLPHRPLEAELFLEAVALWGAFAVLALVPAGLSGALAARLRRARAPLPPTNEADPTESARPRGWALPSLGLLGWTAFPVLAHRLLEPYTSYGQSMAGLASARPWLEIAGLALGLVVAGRLLAPRLERLHPRRLGWALGVAALAAGLFLPFGVGPISEETADAAPADATRPNLLLLVWDTTRAESLSPYGAGRPTTPRLERFADDALLYEEARSVSTFTLSSHVSMLTGTWPSEHGVTLTHMHLNQGRTPTVASLLHEQGYRTGAFVGTAVLRAETGLADGFEVYDDRVDPHVCDTWAWSLVHDVQALLARELPALLGNGNPHWFQDFQRPGGEVLDDALAWIDDGDPRPWFCLVNLYDAHWPYLPSAEGAERLVEPYAGTIDGYVFRSDSYVHGAGPKGSALGPEDKRHLTELYEAELWDLDGAVDAFLSALDLDDGRTGVILTSDHGEAFGEANHWEHNGILEPQVRVPLLLRLPGGSGTEAASAHRVPGRVSGADVAPTLLAMAGLDAYPGMRGHDLLAKADEPDRPLLVEDVDRTKSSEIQVALYREHWKLVRFGTGEETRAELYDLATDPLGVDDVGDAHPDVRAALLAELEELRGTWGGDARVGRLMGGLENADALGALGYAE